MQKYSKKIIKKNNINFFRANFSSSSYNILNETIGLIQVLIFCMKIKPDIIHTASPKANLIGGLVGRILNIPSMVISISGQGYLYTKKNLTNKFFSKLYEILLKFIFKHKNKMIILQNSEDYKKFKELDKNRNCTIIPGSGVDKNKYKDINPKNNNKNILFVGRILKDKGVFEFVEAAKIIKKRFDWNFIIVGPKDYQNPSKVSENTLEKWIKHKVIKWFDYSPDVKNFYKDSSIVCLPSHREGFSKVLLEAAASARPTVTSNIPGCREAIIPNKTGLTFKVKNVNDLVDKLTFLINNKNKRIKYGIEGRKLISKNFDKKIINKKIIKIYNNLLKNAER